METKIEHIRQIALKNRVITIGCFVIGILLCIFVIILHKPKITLDQQQIDAIQSKRDAIEKQNAALTRLIEEQSKSTSFFAIRDSALQKEIRLNRKAIENIKIPNENFKRFDTYTANQWTDYFSKLPEPGQQPNSK